MTQELADWDEIDSLLTRLDAVRGEVRGRCTDEFDLIESAVHYANKKLRHFAFRFDPQPLKQDVAVATVLIELFNIGEGEALPWRYQATYYYAGHKDAFFGRQGTDGTLQAVERSQTSIGSSKDQHWQWVLQVMAQLNLRDTPRLAQLV